MRPGQRYLFKVLVATSPSATSAQSYEGYVRLSTLEDDVVAAIYGGGVVEFQIVKGQNLSTYLTLDASISYDAAYPDDNLTFSWVCAYDPVPIPIAGAHSFSPIAWVTEEHVHGLFCS